MKPIRDIDACEYMPTHVGIKKDLYVDPYRYEGHQPYNKTHRLDHNRTYYWLTKLLRNLHGRNINDVYSIVCDKARKRKDWIIKDDFRRLMESYTDNHINEPSPKYDVDNSGNIYRRKKPTVPKKRNNKNKKHNSPVWKQRYIKYLQKYLEDLQYELTTSVSDVESGYVPLDYYDYTHRSYLETDIPQYAGMRYTLKGRNILRQYIKMYEEELKKVS